MDRDYIIKKDDIYKHILYLIYIFLYKKRVLGRSYLCNIYIIIKLQKFNISNFKRDQKRKIFIL